MKRVLTLLAIVALAAAACSGGTRKHEAIQAEWDVVLWCENVEGEKCELAAGELGIPPLANEAVAEGWFGPITDLSDDCTEPGLAELMTIVSGALGIDKANWHDNVGGSINRDDLPLTYAGAGCTNCCWNEAEPAIKVHGVRTDDGRIRYLVRVWEGSPG